MPLDLIKSSHERISGTAAEMTNRFSIRCFAEAHKSAVVDCRLTLAFSHRRERSPVCVNVLLAQSDFRKGSISV